MMGMSVRVTLLAVMSCICWLNASPAWCLPPERAYETVSPIFKGGYGATAIDGVSADGNTALFTSFGAFSGSDSDSAFGYYQATRLPSSGWSTIALNPPAEVSPYAVSQAFSPSAQSSLWDLAIGAPNSARGSQQAVEQQLAIEEGGNLRMVGPLIKAEDGEAFYPVTEGVSDDFCQVVLASLQALAPEAGSLLNQYYDVGTGCAGESPGVHLLGVANNGAALSPSCEIQLGGGGRRFNTVSADGSVIFFEVKEPQANCNNGRYQLFARIDGKRTLEVSKPMTEACGEVPCAGSATRTQARFWAASKDGSIVYFTTAAPLEEATDKDTLSDLYMATIGCQGGVGACEPQAVGVTSLLQISQARQIGEAADVQGVISAAPDGSRVYFVARGVLSEEGANGAGVQTAPIKGADNVYVYERNAQHPTGRTVFIGDLCSGPVESGSVFDIRCPEDLEGPGSAEVPPRNDSSLWLASTVTAQVSGANGATLVFSTYAQLTGEGPEADTDNAQDVYRYDTATSSLIRVSVGEGGADENGNGQDVSKLGKGVLFNADARIEPSVRNESADEERKIVTQAASDDASRIVFSTADKLSTKAVNGLTDIYEWHNGAVALLSSGSAVEPDERPVITPSGGDVFFVTAQGLVPQDTDGAPDIYDARIGGGFPPPAVQPEACRDGACQGPLSVPAPVLVPDSVVEVAEPAPTTSKVKKKTASKKRHKLKRRHRKAHSKRKKARGTRLAMRRTTGQRVMHG